MYLSSLYIDGYGPYEDTLIEGLGSGLNVIITQDDDGADALRDFFWAVLQGFQSDDSRARLMSRKAAGGFLGFDTEDGPLTIARYHRLPSADQGDDGGIVTVTGPDLDVDSILGRANAAILRRLLTIEPAEVLRFRRVLSEQIAWNKAEQNRLNTEAEFVANAVERAFPSTEEVVEKLRTDRSVQGARVDNLARAVKVLALRLRSTRERDGRLRRMEEIRLAWNTTLELQRQMADLPRLTYMSANPISDLEALVQTRSEIEAQVQAGDAAQSERDARLDSVLPNDTERDSELEIRSLLDRRDEFKSAVDSLHELEGEAGTAEAELRSELDVIGTDWDVERVEAFDSSYVSADVDAAEAAIRDSEDGVSSSRDKVDRARRDESQAQDAVADSMLKVNEMGALPPVDVEAYNKRLGSLRKLQSFVHGIAEKKAELAELHISRSEAGRLGSGVNRLVLLGQTGLSGAFSIAGAIIWLLASLRGDSAVARTGLIMIYFGISGMVFAGLLLFLQRSPNATISLSKRLKRDGKATWVEEDSEAGRRMTKGLLRYCRWLGSKCVGAPAAIRNFRKSPESEAIELTPENLAKMAINAEGVVPSADPGQPDENTSLLGTVIAKTRSLGAVIYRVIIAAVAAISAGVSSYRAHRTAKREAAEATAPPEVVSEQSPATDEAATDEAMADEAPSDETDASAEEAESEPAPPEEVAEEAPQKRSILALLKKYVKVEVKTRSEIAADAEAAASSEPEATSTEESGPGLISRLLKLMRRGSDEADTEEQDATEQSDDDLLGAIAAELDSEDDEVAVEDDDSESEEEPAVAKAVADDAIDVEVPQELLDAQARADVPESKVNQLFGGLLSRFSGKKKTENELLEEALQDPTAEKSAGLASVAVACASSATSAVRRIFAAYQARRAASADASDETPEPVAEQAQTMELEGASDDKIVSSDETDSDSEAPPEPAEEVAITADAGGGVDQEMIDQMLSGASPTADDASTEEPEAVEEPDVSGAVIDQAALDLMLAGTPLVGKAAQDQPSAPTPAATQPETAPEEPEDTVQYDLENPLRALDREVARTTAELDDLTKGLEEFSTAYAEEIEVDNLPDLSDGYLAHEMKVIQERLDRRNQTDARNADLESKRTTQASFEEAARAAETDLSEADWQLWLSSAELSPHMTPEKVRELSRQFAPVKHRLVSLDKLKVRVEETRTTVDEISRRVLRLAGSESVTYISVEEGYETLARIWVEVEERDAYTSEIEAICNEWEDERAGLEARLDRAVGEVKSVLDQAGARDEIHFREIIEGSLRRQELATRLEQLRLDTPVLTGTDSKDLEHELRATPPERVEAELAELPERIERLHEQLTDLEDNLAEAEVALGMIPPMPDAFPNLVGNQYRAVPGGVGFTPLPNLFAKALRQPHLDAAGRMLAGLMHGKYRSIAPVRDDEDRPIHGFKVIDASGAEVDPLDEETSALYMALRMALIAVTASGAPNLPLLLNDFTGKMDVEATQDATAALLATFANSQIVFVTASESVAGTLKASARGSDDPVHVIDATQSESPWRNVING